MHDRRQGCVPMRGKILVDKHRHVVADGFGQTGGGNADQVRMILGNDIVQRQLDVGPATEDRRLLAEIGAGDIDRFLIMADQITPDIGGAALRAVQQRHGAGNALENQGGPQRCAQFTGILCRSGRWFGCQIF